MTRTYINNGGLIVIYSALTKMTSIMHHIASEHTTMLFVHNAEEAAQSDEELAVRLCGQKEMNC